GGRHAATTWHRQASFRSSEFELIGRARFIWRFLPRADAGVSVMYSDIRQPRSWFGYRYGDPDDSVRGESAYFFLRQQWRRASSVRPYMEIGTGPMWSNRLVPAATCRFYFHSQFRLCISMFLL